MHPNPFHRFLLHIQQQIPHSSVCLLAPGQDLARWQNEAIGALVSQFRGERVVSAHDVVHVVNAAAGCLVDGRADRAGSEARTEDGLDGRRGAAGERLQLAVFLGEVGAGVAVGWAVLVIESDGLAGEEGKLTSHEQLRVRVPVDEELDALRGLGGAQPSGQSGCLGSIALR